MSSPARSDTLAVLIPCLNEETTIGAVVRDFRRVLPDAPVYVFDNASTDRSAVNAAAAGAIVVSSPRRGKGHVVRHMFASVDVDRYLLVDGDDTYPADRAPALLEALRRGGVDMTVGARTAGAEPGAFRRFHRLGNRLVSGLIATLFHVPATDVMSGYRALSRDFVQSVPLLSEGFEIETEMILQAATKGFAFRELPVDYRRRPKGSASKLDTVADGWLVLRTLFLIVKDYKPLFAFSIVSAGFAILSLLAGWGPVQDYLTTGLVPRFPRAILAAGLGVLSGVSMGVALILDTLAKYQRETFEIWRRHVTRRD